MFPNIPTQLLAEIISSSERNAMEETLLHANRNNADPEREGHGQDSDESANQGLAQTSRYGKKDGTL